MRGNEESKTGWNRIQGQLKKEKNRRGGRKDECSGGGKLLPEFLPIIFKKCLEPRTKIRPYGENDK